MTTLVIWARSIGVHYDRTSATSVRLHDILKDVLPSEVANSPRLITEAVIDPEGRVVSYGKGPQVVSSLPKGDVKGYYRTVDVLVINDDVGARAVREILRGDRSAKGLVVPVDYKFGGASMSAADRKDLASRLGAAPVFIGEHGLLFTTRAKLRRTIDRLRRQIQDPGEPQRVSSQPRLLPDPPAGLRAC